MYFQEGHKCKRDEVGIGAIERISELKNWGGGQRGGEGKCLVE